MFTSLQDPRLKKELSDKIASIQLLLRAYITGAGNYHEILSRYNWGTEKEYFSLDEDTITPLDSGVNFQFRDFSGVRVLLIENTRLSIYIESFGYISDYLKLSKLEEEFSDILLRLQHEVHDMLRKKEYL